MRGLLAGLADADVQRHGDGYRLQIEPDRVDVWRFRALIRAGRHTAERLGAMAAFEQALALWRGPALADVPGTAAVAALRSGLAEELMSARQDRIAVLLEGVEPGGELQRIRRRILAGNPPR